MSDHTTTMPDTAIIAGMVEIERLRRKNARLLDENYRLKVLLSETQGTGFPHVPAWFSEAVTLILEQEDNDD